MANEPHPDDAFFGSCSRVSTRLVFEEGAFSSYESPAPSASGVPECGLPRTVFSFRTL